ncbi:17002_t:CDS:2, partial [Gigaspora margarita]
MAKRITRNTKNTVELLRVLQMELDQLQAQNAHLIMQNNVQQTQIIEQQRKISALKKRKRKNTKNDVDKFLWQESLKEKHKIHSIYSILSNIRNLPATYLKYDNLLKEYKESLNFSKYVKDKFKEIFNRKKTADAEDKYKFSLLLNHLITQENYNYDLKTYKKACFERITDLHAIIGRRILELPVSFEFFSGTHGIYGIKTANSLVEWFKYGKTCDEEAYKALILDIPFKVDFESLPNRIDEIKDQIKDIEHGQSYYYREAVQRIERSGIIYSRTALAQFDISETIIPGYYEQIGLRIITEKLNQIFIETEIINDKTIGVIPNKFDYLFFVAVPETAVRLIMKDFNCEYDSAKDIMVKSATY